MSEESLQSTHSGGTAEGEQSSAALSDDRGSFIFSLLISAVDILSELCDIGRTQILVGISLIFLIAINVFLASAAWARYSKTIVSFFEEEAQEKLRAQREKEGKDSD